MPTNVPAPTWGPTGFVSVPDSAILAGRQADINAAFGGNLSQSLTTPQGQLASSDTAIISDAYAQFLALTANVDPATAEGTFQDAIGYIYFLTRIAAQSTVVVATCTGATGTVIPVNASAVDQSGNVYLCTEAGTIPSGGSINLTFACSTTGPIACPAGFLSAPYQTIPGWDAISNSAAGVTGRNVETRAEFEQRRKESVAANAQGSVQAIQGAVLSVPGVLDAKTYENPLATANGSEVTASISGTTMTVTAFSYGTINVGDMVTGTGVLEGTIVTALPSGGGGVTGSYTVNQSQTVSSASLYTSQFGIVMAPHSIQVSVVGGEATAVAQAIWSKKSAGCNYNGNTTVTVTDTNPAYVEPYPTYSVTYCVPTSTPILFAITLQSNSNVPSNYAALVQAAVTAAFTGADGGQPARIGSILFASRFYAGIAALGSWARIYQIQLGTAAANLNSIQVRGDQVPTISNSNITVTLQP